MAALLLNCSRASFVSCLPVANQLKPYNFRRREIHIVPVPSNIPQCENNERAKSIRSGLVSQREVLIGHFGLFSPKIEALLTPSLEAVLTDNPHTKALFIGEGSNRYYSALALKNPHLGPRLSQTGSCSPAQIAEFISACDCIFQPYQDGICTKRTTAMAALRNGKLLMSTESDQTEEIWKSTPAVHLIPTTNADQIAKELTSIIRSPERLKKGSAAAHNFYQANFSIDKTISALKAYTDLA
jgi:glycosyltransferase involved in cell wall biosynthesis